jgi:hypothetical protein
VRTVATTCASVIPGPLAPVARRAGVVHAERIPILPHELQPIRRVAHDGVHALGVHLAHNLDAIAEVEAYVAVV